MTACFVDSSVLLIASGDSHPDREVSRRLVDASMRGDLVMHVSVETVQEVLFHRMRRSVRADAVATARSLTRACVLHPFDSEVLQRSIELVATTPIRGRDAVLAATALLAGFTSIVSLDSDFEVVPGLSRISPARALD